MGIESIHAGDVIQFREIREPGDEAYRGVVLEDRDTRVLVRDLNTGLAIAPTHSYDKSELKLAAEQISLTLWVPAKFWDDHRDRCPADDPDTQIAQEVRRAGNSVEITGSGRQIECLRSDAAFYCHRDGPDECPPAIKRSAKATLAAITKAIQNLKAG